MPESTPEITVHLNLHGDIVLRQRRSPDGGEDVIVLSPGYVPLLVKALQAQVAGHEPPTAPKAPGGWPALTQLNESY